MNKAEINLTPTATLLEIEGENKILCRSWGTPGESKAAFLLVHGLGGHSGWFEALARRLKVKQIFVLALDLAGFGRRTNDKYISVRHWLKDIETVSGYLHSLMGDKPVFLLGNSMGGLLALKTCPLIKPSGLALLSPAFAGHPKLFPLSYQLPVLWQALIDPDKEITLPYGVDLITKEERLRAWLEKNGNRRRGVPAKVLLDLLFLTQSLRLKRINILCPLFMITAGMDGIISNQASEIIYRQISAPAKKKIIMPKAMHDLTLDLCLEQVTESLMDWSNSVTQADSKIKLANKSKA
jgi:alpha-beta hydrolase superfamily lysophospholipase